MRQIHLISRLTVKNRSKTQLLATATNLAAANQAKASANCSQWAWPPALSAKVSQPRLNQPNTPSNMRAVGLEVVPKFSTEDHSKKPKRENHCHCGCGGCYLSAEPKRSIFVVCSRGDQDSDRCWTGGGNICAKSVTFNGITLVYFSRQMSAK